MFNTEIYIYIYIYISHSLSLSHSLLSLSIISSALLSVYLVVSCLLSVATIIMTAVYYTPYPNSIAMYSFIVMGMIVIFNSVLGSEL